VLGRNIIQCPLALSYNDIILYKIVILMNEILATWEVTRDLPKQVMQ
jgi:hypothetical protein